jgi:hypothetical protein
MTQIEPRRRKENKEETSGVLNARRVLLIIAFSLGACDKVMPPLDPLPTLAPTRNSAPQKTITSLPTSRPPTFTAAPRPTNTVTMTPLVRPRYEIEAQVDYATRKVEVAARITVTPPAADELVFNVNALQSKNVFHLEELRLNESNVVPRIDGVWLHIPITASITSTITFVYTLTLPPIQPYAWGWRGTLGWTPRQINLGDWYPTLAVYRAGWITHTPSDIGEYYTTESSDFKVRLQINGAQTKPLVLGSGQATSCETATCFTLTNARFVSYVISDKMKWQATQTSDGVTVSSVYFAEHAAAGIAALQTAAAAITTYNEKFGAYPYPSFTIVEGDFYDGMEYSGMSFVGASYYQDYDRPPQNLLMVIAAHETAHQWWHSQMGNDPALEPWLDESLATYSELIFIEAHHPQSAAWWWRFRVEQSQPTGAVNSPIYAFNDFRLYVNAVYLRGAQMLHEMRQKSGEKNFGAFLKSYASTNANHITTAENFWLAYQTAGGEPSVIQAQYFGK